MDETINILLVEDEPDDAYEIAELLSWHMPVPYEFRHVQTLTESIQECSKTIPDIEILDLGLPETAGPETVKAAKLAHPDLCILAITRTSSSVLAGQCIRWGAESYLAKSQYLVDPELLTQRIICIYERCKARKSPPDMERLWQIHNELANSGFKVPIDRMGG